MATHALPTWAVVGATAYIQSESGYDRSVGRKVTITRTTKTQVVVEYPDKTWSAGVSTDVIRERRYKMSTHNYNPVLLEMGATRYTTTQLLSETEGLEILGKQALDANIHDAKYAAIAAANEIGSRRGYGVDHLTVDNIDQLISDLTDARADLVRYQSSPR